MSDDPRLGSALATVWPGAQTAVTPIEAGITNRNYRVEVDGDVFVVRLAGARTELLGIDRQHEVEAGRAAAGAGVGPEVVAFVPELGCVVTRFVHGDAIPDARLAEPEVIRAIVASIRSIHGCAPIAATFPVFRIVEEFRETAAERGVAIPPAYEEARAVADRIEAAFSSAPMPLTTCHNDLLNANLLLDAGHVWIVDYEYAGMGDPFFDLGNFSINNGLGRDAEALVLEAYFGEVRDVHRARLALMRIVSDFREAMWGVVQQGISELEFDYVGYAERHFTRLLANAQDDRLPGWLRAAAVPV